MSNRAMGVVAGAVAGIVGIGVLVEAGFLGRVDADVAIDILKVSAGGAAGYAIAVYQGKRAS